MSAYVQLGKVNAHTAERPAHCNQIVIEFLEGKP